LAQLTFRSPIPARLRLFFDELHILHGHQGYKDGAELLRHGDFFHLLAGPPTQKPPVALHSSPGPPVPTLRVPDRRDGKIMPPISVLPCRLGTGLARLQSVARVSLGTARWLTVRSKKSLSAAGLFGPHRRKPAKCARCARQKSRAARFCCGAAMRASAIRIRQPKRSDLIEPAVSGLDKRTTKAAGRSSPHRLRHAHGSHAIDGGAMLPEVRATSATTTSPQPVVTCRLGRPRRTACALIQEYSFDEDQDRPMIGSEQSFSVHDEGSYMRPLQ
jgi:hypothetical protein